MNKQFKEAVEFIRYNQQKGNTVTVYYHDNGQWCLYVDSYDNTFDFDDDSSDGYIPTILKFMIACAESRMVDISKLKVETA